MARQAAIVGAGYCEHAVRRSDVNMAEMVREAIENCLKNCNMEFKDVDAIVNGNMPSFEGVNMPEFWMTDWIGARNKPLMRVTTGGTTGSSVAIAGYYNVAAGLPGIDTVMVIAFEQQSQGDTALGLSTVAYGEIGIHQAMGYPMERMTATFGAGAAIGIASYQAINYMKRSGATEEDLARVCAQNRRNAAKTWWAHLKMPNYTIEQCMATPYVLYPMRFGMVTPASDGACAVIYTTEEKAKQYCDIPVYVNGVASVSNASAIIAMGGAGGAQLDPCEQLSAVETSKVAYTQAGISFPEKEIDYAEVYAPFPNQELMWLERMGIFEENTAHLKTREGVTAWGGELPVNCSGGVNATNAIGASALERVTEAALQIQGRASNQVKKKTIHTAIGHGWGGAINLVTLSVLSDQPRRKWKGGD